MEVIEQTTHDRVTQSASFRLEEATIDELHQAIRAGQTSCLAVGRHYLARVRAFNGVASALLTQDGAPTLESTGTVRAGAPLRFPCDTVKATTILPNLDQYRGPSLEFGRMEATASDPSVQQQFGMIVGIPNARQVNALATLNIRGERSVTCRGEFGKATRIPVHRKARPLLWWRPERWHDKGGLMRGRINRPTIAVVALLAALCLAPRDQAASAPEIDASVSATLEDFFREVWSGRDLANQAVAILVFPTIVKAGFGIGGEYGEGALHIRGRTAGYYNIVSASIGFQFGAQARSVIIMFMTEAALANFQRTDGWKVGIDGSIAIITVGAGGQIDTSSIRSPVIGFIFDQKGLMYNLTLEGSKISRIQR